jgi:hypothetical protein
MSLYALPIIGRSGLGNNLLPWARAEIFSRRTGARILAPRWTMLRVGPYIRREPEKRRYGKFFYAKDHVHGLRRAVIRAAAKYLSEDDALGEAAAQDQSIRPNVVVFEGTRNLFQPLIEQRDWLKARLWEMTSEKLLPPKGKYGSRFIAAHVRRGDITRQGFAEPELKQVHQYTSVSWFAAMIEKVRRNVQLSNVPIVVFTDGSELEVANLLKVPGVQLHVRQTAITDLWILSEASLLFATGFSTFSMWASYLGRMPTVYSAGKMQQPVQTGYDDAFEIELAEDQQIPAAAYTQLASTRR